jgi:type VI secretion system secreted protein Hcp
MSMVDYFLKIEGIEGESQDDKHKNEIHLHSFSFGAHQTGTHGGGGGGGSGKASCQDLSFVKHVDKSSPKLFLACVSGQHIKKAWVTCRKAGKTAQEYWKITLEELHVSSYTTGGPHDGVALPTDQVSINYGKIELEYKEQKPDGSLGGSVKAGYNAKEQKVC